MTFNLLKLLALTTAWIFSYSFGEKLNYKFYVTKKNWLHKNVLFIDVENMALLLLRCHVVNLTKLQRMCFIQF